MARERGDAAQARAYLEESLALRRELDDRQGILGTTNILAEALILDGQLTAAKTILEENLIQAQQEDLKNDQGWALNHLGHIAQLQGDPAEARRFHEASLMLFGELGPRHPG